MTKQGLRLALTIILCTTLLVSILTIKTAYDSGALTENAFGGITGMVTGGNAGKTARPSMQALTDANLAPKWIGASNKFTVAQNGRLVIDLNILFSDPEGQPLTYIATQSEDLRVDLQGYTLTIDPEHDFVGERIVTIIASDGEKIVTKRIRIEVGEITQPPAPQQLQEQALQQQSPKQPEFRRHRAVGTAFDPAIDEALKQNRTIKVIITLASNVSVSFSAKSRQERRQAIQGMRSSIKNIRQQMLNNVPNSGADITVLREYDTISAVGAELTKQGLDELQANPLVDNVILNPQFTADLSDSVPLIDANDVWAMVTPNNTNLTGAGEAICIIDTGIDLTHPAFANKIIGGYDYINSDDSPQDDSSNSHGTHTAGIAVANASFVKGVAPDARIIPLKVCGSGNSCDGLAILSAIDYCNNNSAVYGITALSASLGDNGGYDSTTCPTWFDDAFATSNSLGIIPVFASGNNGYTNGISYPACSPYVLSVGSSSKADSLDSFTNRGNGKPDVLAPGNSITSTIIGGGTGSLTGTSMATPHVAGAIAIIQENEKSHGLPVLSLSQMRELLQTTGITIGELKRINILNAVNSRDSNLTINSSENAVFTSFPPKAKVKFKQSVDMDSITGCSNMRYNFVSIDSVNCPQYNKSAHITFEGLPWSNANALRNDQPCPALICQNQTFANGIFEMDVTEFSNYSTNVSFTAQATNFSNISITKTDTPDPANASENLTYQINVSNTGNSTAYNVTVNDAYPNEIIYLTSLPDPLAGTNNSWILGNLTQGTNFSINVTVLVLNITNGTIINNTANVTYNNETSGLLSSIATQSTTVNNPPLLNFTNISITKTDNPDPVTASTNLVYQINISNTGNSTAYNVTVNDTYPNEVIYLAAVPTPETGTNNTWTLGNLTQGTNISINITVLVKNITNGSVINNTANVTYNNETSGLLSSIATQSTTVNNPPLLNFTNISITKTDTPDPVDVNTNLNYQINIRNTGNSTAYNVTVNDTYPNEVIYLTAVPTPLTGTNNTWILGNLAVGTNISINVTVLVNSITHGVIINNTANATWQNETSGRFTETARTNTTVSNTPPQSPGGSSGGGGGGGGGGASRNTSTTAPQAKTCFEDWACADWTECTNSKQSRECTDTHACGTSKFIPPTERACTKAPEQNKAQTELPKMNTELGQKNTSQKNKFPTALAIEKNLSLDRLSAITFCPATVLLIDTTLGLLALPALIILLIYQEKRAKLHWRIIIDLVILVNLVLITAHYASCKVFLPIQTIALAVIASAVIIMQVVDCFKKKY